MKRRTGITGMLILFGVGFFLGYVMRGVAVKGNRLASSTVKSTEKGKERGKVEKLTRQEADSLYTRYDVDLFEATSPSKGPKDAPVTIVEVSDFQCPFCARARKTIAKILKEDKYRGKIRLIWHNNPLGFHRRAKFAARAAMAAFKQGKFWQYHDKLFSNQQHLEDQDLQRYATDLGLDIDRWKKDYLSGKFDEQIKREQAQAAKFGARGTPAFFINGRFLSGAQPQSRFEALIDFELSEASALVRKGIEPSRVYTELTKNALKRAKPRRSRRIPREDPDAVYKIKLGDSPYRGIKDALVTLVVFDDFQCPYCRRLEPTLVKLLSKYKKELKVVWKDNPLPFHKRALAATRAAHAAAVQGKFWQYHDKLFANQQHLEDQDLEKYAKEVGLNVARWKKDYQSGRFDRGIRRDAAFARKIGALGTPNSYINGHKLVGAQPYSRFEQLVEREIRKARALLKRGVKRSRIYDELTKDGVTTRKMLEMRKTVVIGDAPVKGPRTAKVTIVEFSDFVSPACKKAEKIFRKVIEKFKDNVRVAFKQYPLPGRKDAFLAAEAALAAQEQGKFWDYHDRLFKSSAEIDRKLLERYAAAVGMDVRKFRQALDSQKFKSRIEKESKEAEKLGVRGVPAFFINGVMLRNFNTEAGFDKAIEGELNRIGRDIKPSRAFKFIPLNQAGNLPHLMRIMPKATNKQVK
ncbi:MAG: thioredoxin domain-containing protein [Deltaproteobacteria bacterium]|nr:thioredoxin domain-containing protein [Deltaproteobacteria bacterium]